MPKPKARESSTQSVASLLVLEDEYTTSQLLCALLKAAGLSPIPCYSAANAETFLRDNDKIHAMLIDLSLPDGDGIEVMRKARKVIPGLPCFVLTAKNSVNSAVQAMKAGAEDYFIKPFDSEVLIPAIKGAMEVYGKRSASRIHDICAGQSAPRWKSPAYCKALEMAGLASKSLAPVLLTGAPDSGKKSLAKFIHQSGGYGNKPFYTINFATMTPEQMEQVMFGTPLSQPSETMERTGGRLERSSGSTIYIENIDLLDLSTQEKLFEWITANETSLTGKPAPCRLIAASEANLDAAIRDGRFRQNLWYALAAFHVEVPCLSERPEDIPLLCESIITDICVTHKLRRPSKTRRAFEMIMDHSWPGNIIELFGVLEYAVTHTDDGLICPDNLPRLLGSAMSPVRNGDARVDAIGAASIDDITKASLLAALEACSGNRRRTAQRLGVSLRTIYNMIHRYDIGKAQAPDTPNA